MGYIRAYYEQILPLQESEWAFIALNILTCILL